MATKKIQTVVPASRELALKDFLPHEVPEEHRLMANLVYNLAERCCHTLEHKELQKSLCLDDLMAIRTRLLDA